ncbi:MAG TPA: DNA polymerase III subunit beta [Streptosporangiaceae bacterium]|nr:DNA polymerase III subunit beta [Streptosporangiaceae bacterium]
MQILVERDVFADAVAWTARALPARPTVPVLAGMRLHAEDGELTLSSFDYDVSALAKLPVDAEATGSALVSGRLLAEISRSLPGRPVQINSDGGRAVLTCGSATFNLLTMPEDEYPALPEMPPAAGTVGSDAFATAVSQTAVAAGRDDTLPSLTGVRIEIEGDTLTLISTDRYRLAIRELRWTPARPDMSAAVLVPAKALTDTARSLTTAAEVSIALALPGEGTGDRAAGYPGAGYQGAGYQVGGDGMIGFEAGGRRTTTRLLSGEFPRYRTLLPATVSATAEVSTAVLAESVRRVALVAERNTAVRLSFSADQLTLEAGTGDEAQADEVIEAAFDGEDLTIAFNPTYLLDGLTAMDSDTTRIAFTEPGKPALLTGKPGPDGSPDYRYLLMPFRLNS